MFWIGFLIGVNHAIRRARWAAANPPPFPPNYINPDYSTGVPPPPKPATVYYSAETGWTKEGIAEQERRKEGR